MLTSVEIIIFLIWRLLVHATNGGPAEDDPLNLDSPKLYSPSRTTQSTKLHWDPSVIGEEDSLQLKKLFLPRGVARLLYHKMPKKPATATYRLRRRRLNETPRNAPVVMPYNVIKLTHLPPSYYPHKQTAQPEAKSWTGQAANRDLNMLMIRDDEFAGGGYKVFNQRPAPEYYRYSLLQRYRKCPDGQFSCPGNGRCVPWQYRCDGIIHCEDYTDELGCGVEIVCKPDEFRCSNGQCIKTELKCNQLYECLDRSDENDCPTPLSSTLIPSTDVTQSTGILTDYRTYYYTPSVPISISNNNLDRISTAISSITYTDSVPEFDISTVTPTIPRPTQSAPVNCHQAEFGCSDGTCIDVRLKCNFIIDCPDGSDERECVMPREVYVAVQPDYLRYFQGSSRSPEDRYLTIKCLVNGTNSYRVSWRRLAVDGDSAPIPPSFRQINQDLVFDTSALEPSHSGSYRCEVTADDEVTQIRIDASAIFKIDVIPRESTLPPQPTTPPTGEVEYHVTTSQSADRQRSRADQVTTSSRGFTTDEIEREDSEEERRDHYEIQKKEYELKKDAYYRARTSTVKPREVDTTTSQPIRQSSFTEQVHRPILTNHISPQQQTPSMQPVEIFIRPRELQLEQGGSGTIEVHVRHRDRNIKGEEVAWKRMDGEALPSDRIYSQYNGRRFVIRNAQTSDSTTYVCTITLIMHQNEGQPRIFEEKVTVSVKPAIKPDVPAPRLLPAHPYTRQSVPSMLRLKVEPADITIYPGERARLTCQVVQEGLLIGDSKSQHDLAWIRLSGRDSPKLPVKSIVSGSELLIPDINREDQGHYACTLAGDPSIRSVATLRVYSGQRRADPSSQTRTESLRLHDGSHPQNEIVGERADDREDGNGIEDEETDKRSPPNQSARSNTPYRCEIDEATCSNGECIKRTTVCDGKPDCSDGSDESNCPGSAKAHRDGNFQKYCEPNEYRCDNGRCIQKIWLCDGDDDCGDTSDERNCAVAPPGSPCKSTEFRCVSGNQCIPSSYQCDGEIDCLDRSDEIGCAPPVIVQPPQRDITVKLGSTVEITCLARGTPVPLISWRLNWGHIPIAPRITTKSSAGFGTLTIRNVQATDQGAYSCEAINNRDAILATPDAILTLESSGRPSPPSHPPSAPIPSATGRHICQPPYFNHGARSSSDCLVCYCSGRTTQCYSSDQLYLSEITQRSPISSATSKGKALASNLIQALPDGVSIQRNPNQKPVYIDLPTEFLGNRLKSYGSQLKFNLYYDVQNERAIQNVPYKYAIVILEGESNQKLYHHVPKTPAPDVQNDVTLVFNENSFATSPEPGYGARVDRQTFMNAIKNIKSLKLLATFHPAQSQIRVTGIKLGDASNYDNRRGKAYLIEECRCPPGYSGLSCETCSPGFDLIKLPGQTLGNCVSCSCNGHSTQCDPGTKTCLNCQHNTEGSQCERCRAGYYGNALLGRSDDCKPCACPLTNPTNNFSPTCTLDSDNQLTCTQCPPGFTGRRCESCAYGYTGNPNNPGDTCRFSQYTTPGYIPRPPQPRPSPAGPCNAVGALNANPDPQSGSCACKGQTTGLACDQCKPNAFHMSPENPQGCVGCFCMGLTNDCKSCRLYRSQQRLDLKQQQNALKLSTLRMADRGRLSNMASPTPSNGYYEIRFSGDTSRSPTTYWELPSSFLGNRVTSYGGALSYALEVTGYGRPNTDPDVEISGNNIHLIYDGKESVRPNQWTPRKIKFFENYWKREDGKPADREHLMMTLAGLNRILIKATYFNSTQSTKIRDISLDVADERGDGSSSRVYASAVEQCRCPAGYKGLSCEECSQGYTRTDGGLYLGSCQPCSCNRRSTLCHPVDGTCQNCINSDGPHCDRCQVGFYGNSNSPCKPCPCPPIQGQQGSCHVDVTDGQATCDKCPLGFTGRLCDSCVAPFVRDPRNLKNCYIPPTHTHPETSDTNRKPLDSRVSFSIQDPRQIMVNEGQTATFTCTPQSEGIRLDLEWTKQNGVMPANSLSSNGILKIGDVKASDSGIYVCGLRGADESSPKVTVRLDVKGRRYEPLKIFITPTLINANAGDSGSFQCNVQGIPLATLQQPGVNIKWYKHNGNLPREHRIKGNVLEFQNVIDSDSGLYVCEMSGPIGHYRSTARLLVEFMKETTYFSSSHRYPTTNLQTPTTLLPTTPFPSVTATVATLPLTRMVVPSVSIRPREISLTKGSSATITCETTGTPEPTITWVTKNGQAISSKHQVYRNKLRLLSVDVEDSGVYVCRATNALASAKGEIYVNVQAPQPPKLAITPTSLQNIKVGGNAHFECNLGPGESGSSLTWARLQDKNFIPETTQVTGRVLRFNNVNGKEKGQYQCSSTNSAGTTRQLVTLNIEGIPLVTITPTSPVRVLEGDMVSFECTAEGDPLPSVEWVVPKHIEVENPLEENQETRRGDIPSASAIFEITHVERKDAGRYTCLAKNALGQTEETLELIVENAMVDTQMDSSRTSLRIRPVKIEPDYLKLKNGDTAQFRCIVSGQSQYRVEWKRAGNYKLNPKSYTAEQGHKLIIPDVGSSDKGEYLCYAHLISGGYIAANAKLSITSNVELSVSPSTQTVEVGQTFRIACSARFLASQQTQESQYTTSTQTTPPNRFVNLQWYRSGPGDSGLLPLRRGAVDYSGLLEVRSATLADRGTYVCTIADASGASPDKNMVITAKVNVVQPSSSGPHNNIVQAQNAYQGGGNSVYRYSLSPTRVHPTSANLQEESIRNGYRADSRSGHNFASAYGRLQGDPIIPSSRRVDSLQIIPSARHVPQNHSLLTYYHQTVERQRDQQGKPVAKQLSDWWSKSSSSSSNEVHYNGHARAPALSQTRQDYRYGNGGQQENLLAQVPTTYSHLSRLLFHSRGVEGGISVTPSLVANEGSDVELLCQFGRDDSNGTFGIHRGITHESDHLMRAHGGVKYTWTKVNGKMPDEFSRINGLLRIKKIKISDSGTYSCKIKARGFPILKKDTYIYVVPNDNRYRRGVKKLL